MPIHLTNKLRNLILCAFTLFLLPSCGGSDSWCFTTSENAYTNTETIETTLNTSFTLQGTGLDLSNEFATPGSWVSTKVSLNEGDQIKLSASGDILIALPYGLKTTTNATEYIIASNAQENTDSFFDNNGLGTELVVLANNTSPVMVNIPSTSNPFTFVASQNIYVTTKDCATGDASSSHPTKWSWEGWNTAAVHCSTRGTRNFTVDAPLCKAIKCCCSDCSNSILNTCSNFQSWQCQPLTTTSASSIVDTCSPSGNNTYNCESNPETSDPCYNLTSYPIEDGDWCDGKYKRARVSVSHDHPSSCSFNDPNTPVTTPVINSCGHTDTCWNTAGYRLYAIQENTICPTDANCIHLNHSSTAEGGKSFQSIGGRLDLKIIDPNTTTTSTVDVVALQNESGANTITMSTLQSQQVALGESIYVTPTGFLPVINSYSAQISLFETDASKYAASNSSPHGMNTISIDLSSLQDTFGIFSGQLLPADEGVSPDPWIATLSTMLTQVNNLITSVNNLTTDNTSPSTTPSDDDVINFKTSASAILTDIKDNINSAQTAQNTIDANAAEIDSLSATNEDIAQQILSANNSALGGAMGGYTVYVRSDSVVASNGSYARAAFSEGDPNNDGSVTDLGILKDITGNVFTAPSSGGIWVKLEDPDGDYSNNSGNYTINIGQITETTGFTTLFVMITDLIKNTLTTSVQSIFERMTCTGSASFGVDCTDYLMFINFILLTYLIVFGMMFLFGLIQTNYVDFLIRLVKIAFIISLTRPGSFEFFNTYLFQAFIDFSNTILSATTGAPIDNPFDFLGQSIAMLLLDGTTYIKIMSLMFQGLLGFVAFVLLVYGVVTFVKAIFNAFRVYIMAFIGLMICFALAPIFIPFILFRETRSLFDNWFKAIMIFTFEPLLLFIGLILLNGMLVGILQQLFNFSACFKCAIAFTFSLPGFPVGGDAILCIPFFSPWGVDNIGSGIAFSLFFSIPLAITFCMVTKIMEIYSKILSNQITRSIFKVSPLFSSHDNSAKMGINPFSGIVNGAKEATGRDDKSKARRAAAGGGSPPTPGDDPSPDSKDNDSSDSDNGPPDSGAEASTTQRPT